MQSSLELARYIVKESVKRWPAIAVACVYGSVAAGTDTEHSDIDMYAILDNDGTTGLPWQMSVGSRVVKQFGF